MAFRRSSFRVRRRFRRSGNPEQARSLVIGIARSESCGVSFKNYLFALRLTVHSIYTDNLIIPAYVAAASAALLILHILLSWTPVRRLISRLQKNKKFPDNNWEPQPTTQSFGIFAEVRDHVVLHGGPTIFFYMVFRFLSSLALLGLSAASLVLDERDRTHGNVGLFGKWGIKHKGKKEHSRAFTNEEWLEASLCLTFVRTIFRMSYIFSHHHCTAIHILPCSHCSNGKTQM